MATCFGIFHTVFRPAFLSKWYSQSVLCTVRSHSTQLYVNFYILLYNKKPIDALISNFILVRNSTYFGHFLCPSSGAIHYTFGTGTCYTLLSTACLQEQDGTLFLQVGCRQKCITCASAECKMGGF
jgi:hypothetical protein